MSDAASGEGLTQDLSARSEECLQLEQQLKSLLFPAPESSPAAGLRSVRSPGDARDAAESGGQKRGRSRPKNAQGRGEPATPNARPPSGGQGAEKGAAALADGTAQRPKPPTHPEPQAKAGRGNRKTRPGRRQRMQAKCLEESRALDDSQDERDLPQSPNSSLGVSGNPGSSRETETGTGTGTRGEAGSGCRCSPEARVQLQIHCVDHSRCPQNKLRCELCQKTFAVNFFHAHIRAEKHRTRLQSFEQVDLYRLQLPPPTEAQIGFFTAWIEKEADVRVVDASGRRQRLEAVERLELLVQKSISERCSLRLYGSSVSGFGLRHCNVNVELLLDGQAAMVGESTGEETGEESSAEMLARISALLRENAEYSNIWNEFNLRVPKLNFTEASSGLRFELVLTAEKSYLTSLLFA